jgi:hypothetical protein
MWAQKSSRCGWSSAEASEAVVNEIETLLRIVIVVAATALPIIGTIWLVAGRGAGREGFGGTGLF